MKNQAPPIGSHGARFMCAALSITTTAEPGFWRRLIRFFRRK